MRGTADALEDSPTTNAVLSANHGLLAFGDEPPTAARLIIAIEESAEAELAASADGATWTSHPAPAAVHEPMAKARQ